MTPPTRYSWQPWVIFIGVALSLFAVRLAAPSNLLDQDQENPAAYVLDVLENGYWACQRDLGGNIASKPPLYTWLGALTSLACGSVTRFSLYLPGALALLGTACLAFRAGRIHFGPEAGLWAALACMLCPAGLKEFGLVRTDGAFAFTVTAAALLAYRAWIDGRGWTWFWLAGSAATLTKGPLGVVLGSVGLLAALWERRSGDRVRLRGSHWLGLLLFAVLCAGWFLLAYWQLGWPVIDKLIYQELVFHVVEGEQKKAPGSLFYLSWLYYLARAAPWSILAYLALWRTWKHPAATPEERRFERFLFCWFLGGLVLFSLAPHQRGDLLWPILPAGALLAGRELTRLTSGMTWPARRGLLAGAVVVGIGGFAGYYFLVWSKHPYVHQTRALHELADEVRQCGGAQFPLTHVDDPAGLQVVLNTYREPITFQEAAALLKGPEAAFVAVHDVAALEAARGMTSAPVFTVLQDRGPVEKLRVRIVSNRPKLAIEREMAFAAGSWLIRYHGALLHAARDRITLALDPGGAESSIQNWGRQRKVLALNLYLPGKRKSFHRVFAPGERVSFSARDL